MAIPCCSHDFGGTRFRAPYHRKHFPTSTTNATKQVSAYTSLCSYVAYLSAQMSFVPEIEYLRIPSTRNIAMIGRKRDGAADKGSLTKKLGFVREFIEKEMGGETSIEQVGLQWLKRGSGLTKPGSGGH